MDARIKSGHDNELVANAGADWPSEALGEK